MTSPTHHVACLPGDGIGSEVLPAGWRVLQAVAERYGFELQSTAFDWGCERYLRQGDMMPPDALETLSAFDAIFLGAVGAPSVPDHVSLWGMLIPIRRGFEQYVNLRPMKLLRGVRTPLAGIRPGDIDMVVVRENTEGEYSRIGGRLYEGTPHETVVQESIFTRRGVERVMRFAFDLAAKRGGRLDSATKSNGIIHTMPFWDEVFADVARQHTRSGGTLTTHQYHIDALAAMLVLDPARFDVIVASNLFGDILTDLGAAVAGSIGIAPSANLNPERDHPSMFEPVHGSAPDIAGRGIANPVGQVWSGAMMLEHLGHADAGGHLMEAVETVLSEGGPRTPDLGGDATTEQVADAIIAALENTGPPRAALSHDSKEHL